jgi:serine/threonine protein kinase/Flp pilus assembly protein TadD
MTAAILSDADIPRTERLPVPPAPWTPCGADADSPDLEAAARAYRAFRERGDGDPEAWDPGQDAEPRHTEVFRLAHECNPDAALKLADAAARLPVVGDRFAEFRLVAELGRGAFGRVFLAEQVHLGDRPVVLKLSVDVRAEAHALARLLHTNIVPVYSVHRSGPLQAVCMPYCGGTTLAHALHRLEGSTVPDSGKHLVTLLTASAEASRPGPSSSGSPETLPVVHQPGSKAVLELLGRLSYVDAILWLAARLADALAHAHDRGILHRDLKPANVLLTDEGQPMLLDFNLATDTRLEGIPEVARLGGTLPYMPPEHIESFGGQKRVVDERGDMYSLGVILFELLTARPPFPVYDRATPDVLRQMVADRRQAPRLRNHNPAVMPAVEAIVRKCLHPDPARRYATAHALLDDLERQLQNRPLRHAANPWGRERMRKWARRHPRLSSAAFLGACAAVLLLASAGVTVYQFERRQGLEARATLGAFRKDARRVQLRLTGLPGEDKRPLVEAAAATRQALSRFPPTDDPDWSSARGVKHLGDDDRRVLREESGTLLVLLAHATARGSDEAAEALRLNAQAAACFPPDAVPPVVWAQRAELLDRLGRGAEAAAIRARGETTPVSGRDLYLAGWGHARHGRYGPAVPLLEAATRKDPTAPWAWFLLAQCHDGLGRDADAIACYGVCLALQPDAHPVWFNRGLAHLRRGDYRNALADFDRAIALQGDVADAYFNRGLAKKALKDYAGAAADLTRALECGSEYTRVYFVRADVRARLGDRAGADADRQEGMNREPVEESCWTARGFARLPANPAGAIEDFDRALDRNPRYRPALMNKAHVLADVLNRPADAVAVLDRAIKYHPEQAGLHAARAVYLARLGRRADAHRAADEALQVGHDAATRYQVAGVYALTSRTHPEDRKEAFRLLRFALKRNYGFEHLDTDPELAPVRHLAEFKDLVAAARALRADRP